MRSKAFLPLALVASFLTAPLTAQDWKGRGRVRGTVKDAGGKPVAGAKVVLAYGDSTQGPTATTDEKGSWAVAALRSGTWNLDVEAPGFVLRKVSAQVPEFGPGPNVEIQLQPAQAAPATAAAVAPATADKHGEELRALLKAGDDLFKEGKFAKARAAYEKVAAERPEILEIQRTIAYCLYKEGNLQAAADKLAALIEKSPAPAPTAENVLLLVNILLEKGDLDRGLEYLGKIDETQVADPATFLNIGVLLFNKGKSEDAARYFDKVLARDPAAADAYYSRGLARIRMNQTAGARADFQKFLELKPAAPEAASAKQMLKELK